MRYVFNGNYVIGLGKKTFISNGQEVYYSGLNVVNETIWIPGRLKSPFVVHVSCPLLTVSFRTLKADTFENAKTQCEHPKLMLATTTGQLCCNHTETIKPALRKPG